MKTLLLTSLAVLSLAACTSRTTKPLTDAELVQTNFDFAKRQLAFAVDQTQKVVAQSPVNAKGEMLVSPRTINEDGTLRLVTIKDWTCGFFPGTLWYTYEHTKDSATLSNARHYTEAMEGTQMRTNTHDLGFLVYCSYGNGYRLTSDTTYCNIVLQAARSLSTRFSPTVGCIRSWDHNADKWNYPVIIDNMMNLEMLFWATRITGDSTFYNIAVSHANTTMKNHFRDDYSCYHVVSYNPENGQIEARNTHQGYADSSSWARGQAWAIYGYTMCYRETGDPKYLAQAQNVASYIFNHPSLPEDLIPYWDYNDPKIPNAPRDVSAATVTASALYELSTYTTENSGQYKQWADKIMQNITASYRAPEDSSYGFLLLHSTGNMPKNDEVDAPINYADYYFVEALTRKHNLETTGKAI